MRNMKKKCSGQALQQSLVRPCSLQAGQAAILIIFVIGMVSLLIGMSLSKTGFQESMMGRSIAGSTKAFYVANSGIEDAFYRIQTLGYAEEDDYTLDVGEGSAKVTIKTISVSDEEDVVEVTVREIISVGKYGNFVRRIRVIAQNTVIAPDFTRFIQAGDGGIEIGQRVKITSSGADQVNIYSKSFVRGRNNGSESGCDSPISTTNIDGNVFAVGSIERLSNGTGPCITGNAYAGNLYECRIFGQGFSGSEDSFDCPYDACDPATDPDCKIPEERPLPDIGVSYIEDHLTRHAETVWPGNCEIGGSSDCSIESEDGTPMIGNMIIEGNLETRSNSALYLSGPVWVKGDVTLESNQTISLDPASEDDTSLIILADGRITADANTRFTSDDNKFLLVASKYVNGILGDPETICEGSAGNAVTINPNVQSILFYAINGCAYVAPTAAQAFLGAILAQGVIIDNNVEIIYNPALKDAEFFLNEGGSWQILSFTEI